MKIYIDELEIELQILFLEACATEEKQDVFDENNLAVKEIQTLKGDILISWDSVLNAIIKGGKPLAEYIPFIYRSFTFYMNQNARSTYCMCCLNEAKKIADSHYVSDSLLKEISDFFIQPGDNQIYTAKKMTLKLFCTGGQSNCEQVFSSKGEGPFKNYFLPFLKKLMNGFSISSNESYQLTYNSWLFYNIISLAFRLMLTDMPNKDKQLILLHRDHPSEALLNYWEFFSSCREFLLTEDTTKNLHIGMYLSAVGLDHNVIIKEHPIMHVINYKSTTPGSNAPSTVFGFMGVYFVLTSDETLLTSIESTMKSRCFRHRVVNGTGNIDINFSKLIPNVPEFVSQAIDAYNRHLAKSFSQYNPEIIEATAQKMKLPIKRQTPVKIPMPSPQEAYQLPPGITIETGVNNKKHIRYQDKYYLVCFHEKIQEAESAYQQCWLMFNVHEKYFFVIVSMGTINGTSFAAAFRFNHLKFPKNIPPIVIPPDLDLEIQPTSRNDISRLQIMESETGNMVSDESLCKKYIRLFIDVLVSKYYKLTGKLELKPEDFLTSLHQSSKKDKISDGKMVSPQ